MTAEPVVVTKLVDSTNSGQGVVLIIDEFRSGGLDVGRCYSIDAAENFCWSHATSVCQKLSANIFGNVGMTIQSHEHSGLQVELCSFHFFVRWGVHQTDQVVHDSPHAIIDLDIGADNVDTEKTSVLVTSVKSTQGVCQFVLGNLLTQTRGVVLADSHGAVEGSKHDLHQHQREGILRSPGGGFVGNGNVGSVIGVESHSVIIQTQEKVETKIQEPFGRYQLRQLTYR